MLTSATAGANVDNASNGTDPLNLSSINLSGEVTYFLGHTSDHSGGNWVALGSPSERRIQLPQPISITYSGPRSLNRGNISGNLSFSNDENYTLNYPSTLDYTTLPVYLPGENVTMSFFGDSALKGNVSVYVLNISSTSAKGILEVLSTGDIKSLRSTFNDTIGGNYTNYSAVLGENGDLLNYDLGDFDPGQYGIILIQKNNDSSLTVLSATAFVVAEYDLNISAPASIIKGSNLDISMAFNGTSGNDSSNFTYGAVLVNEQVYRAIIEINSNGTINGTSVLINGEHFTDKLDINASNYKSKLTKNELQKEIQNLIGEGNGTIAVGEIGQENLSLTTFDLPQGHYYLFAGAYDPKGKIAGLTQQNIEIKSPVVFIPPMPVANFSSNVMIGFAPLLVQFNDSSENANGWYWDFGDGNTSTEKNPMHTYSSTNNYIVNLTASNGNGTSSKSSMIFVLERPPEPLNIVAIGESLYAYVLGGVPTSFDFSSGLTPILGISFTTSHKLDETLVTVYQLNNTSSLISGLPSGIVYEYFDIWINNAGSNVSENFSNATISFKVSKEWRKNLRINPSTITLNRYHNGVWSPLPTTLIGQDADYMYFTAQTPGFSPFAITGNLTGNKIDVNNVSYSIFKSVIGVDETGDCILNAPRDVLQYRIVVKNEGNVSLTNVSVNDSLVNLTGPIGNGTEERILQPGEIWEYTGNYSITTADITNGTVINNASAKCDQLDEIKSNVSTPVTKAKDLQIYKSVTGIDESGDRMVNKIGDIIQYLVAVKNTGDVNLTNVTVADPLANLTKSSGDQKNPEILNPGETWMYIGNYTVTASDISTNGNGSGLITNTATVSCSELSSRNSTYMLPIVPPIWHEPPIFPVANFSTNVTDGYAPLSVQFTDKSQNATSWSWDFNSDKIADSSAQNPPAYTYTTAGNYTANLTVSNANGSASKLATISVQQTSTSSNNGGSGGNSGGSSSGGSGGSSGGSSSGGSGNNSSGNGGSHKTVNNTTSTQVPSKVVPQNEKGAKAGTGNNSRANNDDGTVKIASFLIGLLVILLAGALILKKIGPKQEK